MDKNITITFDEITESQIFEHDQKFVIYEDYINSLKELGDTVQKLCREKHELEQRLAVVMKELEVNLKKYHDCEQDLGERLAEAEKVIEFYADYWNWQPYEDKCESKVFDDDQSYTDHTPPFRACGKSPGKRAREYLAAR